ncbi:MAG TPA: matrixin family metalloprotease [Thermoanaerobaculia bacterium]|nr:matrixin family metalloprotease [Thermoanaerobaculia bacterium]
MRMTGARAVLAVVVLTLALPGAASAQQWDGEVLTLMGAANDGLKAMWMDFRLESIEYYTIGQGRPSDRVHQQPFRWVPGDQRRGADGTRLTWALDESWGSASGNGIPVGALNAALRRATATWAADSCLRNIDVTERKHPPADVTVTDFLLGTGGLGDPFYADVVHAGWMPGEPPLFENDILALAATYIFVDRNTGEPTDVDGDGYMDVALTEIYYNDSFPWAIDAGEGEIDVETVALHEVGHALSLGHFGLPPMAAMNPVYRGADRELHPIDHAGVCAVWQRN